MGKKNGETSEETGHPIKKFERAVAGYNNDRTKSRKRRTCALAKRNLQWVGSEIDERIKDLKNCTDTQHWNECRLLRKELSVLYLFKIDVRSFIINHCQSFTPRVLFWHAFLEMVGPYKKLLLAIGTVAGFVFVAVRNFSLEKILDFLWNLL